MLLFFFIQSIKQNKIKNKWIGFQWAKNAVPIDGHHIMLRYSHFLNLTNTKKKKTKSNCSDKQRCRVHSNSMWQISNGVLHSYHEKHEIGLCVLLSALFWKFFIVLACNRIFFFFSLVANNENSTEHNWTFLWLQFDTRPSVPVLLIWRKKKATKNQNHHLNTIHMNSIIYKLFFFRMSLGR